MATEGRLYVKHGAALREIGFLETPHRLWPQAKTVGHRFGKCHAAF